jgi:hypothetical protein
MMVFIIIIIIIILHLILILLLKIGNITWREWDKSFTIYRPSGFYAGEVISFILPPNLPFYIDKNGIAVTPTLRNDMDNNGKGGSWPAYRISGVTISVISTGSILSPSSLGWVTPIPTVVKSSLLLGTIDPFTNNISNFTINLVLNMNATSSDYIELKLYGIDGINTTDTTIIGKCSNNSTMVYDSITKILKMTVSSDAACSSGISNITWTVIGKNPSKVFSPNSIVQSNSNVYKIKWITSLYGDTGYQNIDSPPSIGLATSSIKFLSPYGGQKSAVLISMITTSSLLKNDQIWQLLVTICCPI